MAFVKTKPPNLEAAGRTPEEKLRALQEYLVAMDKEINHALSSIGEENLSDELMEQLQTIGEGGGGARGKPGPPGEPGKPGSPGYTPQRGTDYWTEEDQDTIVARAVEQIQSQGGGQSTGQAVTLPADGWSDMQQTVAADGVTADETGCLVVISPDPQSHDAYAEAGVRCTSHGEGTLTFETTDVPAETLLVNVLIVK